MARHISCQPAKQRFGQMSGPITRAPRAMSAEDAAALGEDAPKPRVLVLYTGGTIGMKKTSGGYAPVHGFVRSHASQWGYLHELTRALVCRCGRTCGAGPGSMTLPVKKSSPHQKRRSESAFGMTCWSTRCYWTRAI